MAAPMAKQHVDLGFLEKTELFLLRSRFFPSKFGGKPAWLSLKNLPSTDELACRLCSNPTTFLLQVYCPDSFKTNAFHRTVFVFVCKNPTCSSTNCTDNVHVFRSQLPKGNEFYSSDPPVEQSLEKEIDASLHNNLCVVCGCLGHKLCAQCQKLHYCSKSHQRIDWKAGHKQSCGKDRTQDHVHNYLFPEMELVTEEEPADEDDKQKKKDDETEDVDDSTDLNLETSDKIEESELEKMAYKESAVDKQLKKFKKKLAKDPEQVLRYNKGGEPLWIVPEPIPNTIPDCTCGAKRQFEFQILPQLLHHMNVDQLGASLDWGVICVYTCKDSCDTGNQYKREYVFKQDIS